MIPNLLDAWSVVRRRRRASRGRPVASCSSCRSPRPRCSCWVVSRSCSGARPCGTPGRRGARRAGRGRGADPAAQRRGPAPLPVPVPGGGVPRRDGLVATAVSLAPRATRRRVQVALGLVGLQFLLAVSRGPALVGWHLVALATGAVAVGALASPYGTVRCPWPGPPGWSVAGGGRRGARPRLGRRGHGRCAVGDDDRRALPDAAAQVTSGSPARQLQTRPAWGTTVEQFRDRSLLTDTSVTVLVYDSFSADETDPDDGWSEGVLVGNANLLADLRPGFGYTAVGHRGWVGRWCQDLFGLAGSSDPRCVGTCWRTPRAWAPRGSTCCPPTSWPSPVTRPRRSATTSPPRAPRRAGPRGSSSTAAPTVYPAGSPGPRRDDRASCPRRPTASAYYSGRPGDSVEVSTGPDGGAVVLRVPAWPGLRAQVDGRDVPVGSVQGTVLSVDLPADLDGARLDIEFAPPADRLLPVSWGVGGALLAVAVLVQVVPRRRRRDTGGGIGSGVADLGARPRGPGDASALERLGVPPARGAVPVTGRVAERAGLAVDAVVGRRDGGEDGVGAGGGAVVDAAVLEGLGPPVARGGVAVADRVAERADSPLTLS